MMTPQEVANCTFAKAAIGGYHMTSVDEFLDKLTEDYSALYKENAALKAKLKVMVDKMAEYREMEDAMRSTLLTAQKMATSMVAEAEQKRNAMIAGAASAAQNRKNELAREVEAEERRRLALGQVKLREFIREVTIVCNEELSLLDRLPELPMDEEPAPVVQTPPPPVEPETKALNLEVNAPAPVQEEPAAQEEDAGPPAAVAAFAPAPERPQIPQSDPFAEDEPPAADLEATRVLNLEELQFGRNYVKD